MSTLTFKKIKDNDIVDNLLNGGEYTDDADIVHTDEGFEYAPTGDSLCWKCTIKHLGAACEYASEVQRYPHHFIKCIGALVCASRECPSMNCRRHICDFYNQCLSTGTIEDMTQLLMLVYSAYNDTIE
jgi:hypothetical protein